MVISVSDSNLQVHYTEWVLKEISFHFSNLNFEIIVIDDGSPDGTLEAAKQLQNIYGDDKIVSIDSINLLTLCIQINVKLLCLTLTIC